ncbi:MAG: hypothetical protein JOZ37_12635 [Actinobacteria bacterium]|nr:hypothetical protein [Actinomycetota bacterium]MBV9933353.1 hypothetical protein [Actinomycetota bacterium]
MSNNLDNELRTRAAAFDVPPGDVDVVMTRAGHRTRNRRALTTVSTIAAVVALIAVVVSTGSDHHVVPVHVAGEPAHVADLGISWKRVNPGTTLAFSPIAKGAGPVYALSTAPGQVDANAPQNRVVWKSDDGSEWQSVSTLSNDLYIADLSPTSDRIYAVGTGPATAAVGGQKSSRLVSGWSDDGGKTWQEADLPVDMNAVATKSSSSGLGIAQIASGAKGTVAVATPTAQLDVNKVLPNGATAPYGWALTETGVDVLGAPPAKDPCPAGTVSDKGGDTSNPAAPPGPVYPTYCMPGDGSKPAMERTAGQQPVEVSPQQARGVTASYTWAQLGVDGDLLKAIKHQPIGFYAPPGSTHFERIDLPTPDGTGDATAVVAGKDGFDVVLSASYGVAPTKTQQQPPSQLTIVHSADGRTWDGAPSVEHGVSWTSASGLLNGQPAIVAEGDGGPVLLRSDGAGNWTPTSLGALIDAPAGTDRMVTVAGIGPFGVVAVIAPVDKEAGSRAQPDFRVLTSRDGITWQSDRLSDVAGMSANTASLVYVTANQAVLKVSPQPTPGSKKPGPDVTLVATAK